MNRWLKGTLRGTCIVSLISLAGCGASRDEGLISSTQVELASANTSIETMASSLKDYLKAKDAKDEEGAKKEYETSVAAAKSFKKAGDKLQGLFRQAESAALPTAEERKAFNDANKAKLERIASTMNDLAEQDRKFKSVLAEVTTKYEKDVKELLKELQDADLQFAALTRKR